MRSSLIGVVAAGSALAVAAAGCGGAKLSKPDLIRRADARCAQDNRRISAIPQPTFSPQGTTRAQLPQAARYLARVNPIHGSEIGYLHGLGEPTQGADQWKQILDQADQAGAALRDAERYARAGDLVRFKAQFSKLERNRYPQLARKFGLTECGQG
jgi:hypothetical protein